MQTFNLFIIELESQTQLSRDILDYSLKQFPGQSLQGVIAIVSFYITQKLDTDPNPFIFELLLNGRVQVWDLIFEMEGPFLQKQTLARKKIKRRK